MLTTHPLAAPHGFVEHEEKIVLYGVVLLDGIEPSTSSLPMTRSATELQQRVGWSGQI